MDFERYSRQTILKEFGLPGQQKLAEAKVLVIGAGGLGCPALQYLTAAGVGEIGIVDGDKVSLTNLHRQVLYQTDDIGHLKAEVASLRLKKLNPDVHLVPYAFRLDNNNALELINRYDWILDGTDNFASRYMINDACVLLNKPLVFAAVSKFQGQLAVFNVSDENNEKTNYRDIFPDPPIDGEIPNCAEAGVLGVLPGIIGTMQAAEIIKLITGIGRPLINKLLTYDLLNNDIYEVTLTPSPPKSYTMPNSPAEFFTFNYNNKCEINLGTVTETDLGTVTEINGDQFEMLSKEEFVQIIDVREIGEVPLLKDPGIEQMPMSAFSGMISNVTGKNILLICQHGIRSLRAAELLQKEFGATKKIYSLKGGIVRWRNHFNAR